MEVLWFLKASALFCIVRGTWDDKLLISFLIRTAHVDIIKVLFIHKLMH